MGKGHGKAPPVERRHRTQARGSAGHRPAKLLSRVVTEATEATAGFPVSVLAERTATLVPTIHHYRHIGLLPDATALASNRFLYDERHVDALIMIRLLRDRRHMPLEAIREVLPDVLALDTGGLAAAEAWDGVIVPFLDQHGSGGVRQALVVAAREAFAQRGFAQVNVADICKQAGIAKGSFYRYFDSKEEIFLAAARSMVDVVAEEFEGIDCPLTEREAVEHLQEVLGPMAPLLLEVATEELRHQANATGVVASIAAGLATHLMPRLTKGGSLAAARRVVDSALTGLLRPTLVTFSSRP